MSTKFSQAWWNTFRSEVMYLKCLWSFAFQTDCSAKMKSFQPSLYFGVWKHRCGFMGIHLYQAIKQADVLSLGAAKHCHIYRCPKKCCSWICKDDSRLSIYWLRLNFVSTKIGIRNGCRRSHLTRTIFPTKQALIKSDNSWWGMWIFQALGSSRHCKFPSKIDGDLLVSSYYWQAFSKSIGGQLRPVLMPTERLARSMDCFGCFIYELGMVTWERGPCAFLMVPLQDILNPLFYCAKCCYTMTIVRVTSIRGWTIATPGDRSSSK